MMRILLIIRILNYTDAPEGIIKVHIPGGARYGFVEIPRVGSARDADPFYNGKLQMINIGEDKYLLFVHTGGDFSIRLKEPNLFNIINFSV